MKWHSPCFKKNYCFIIITPHWSVQMHATSMKVDIWAFLLRSWRVLNYFAYYRHRSEQTRTISIDYAHNTYMVITCSLVIVIAKWLAVMLSGRVLAAPSLSRLGLAMKNPSIHVNGTIDWRTFATTMNAPSPRVGHTHPSPRGPTRDTRATPNDSFHKRHSNTRSKWASWNSINQSHRPFQMPGLSQTSLFGSMYYMAWVNHRSEWLQWHQITFSRNAEDRERQTP